MSAAPAILVYSMGEVIGDGLIKLPFIASLKGAFPNARLVWCAAKGSTVYTGVLKTIVEGFIDEVIDDGVTGVAPSDLLLFRKPFGGRTFDIVIDTQTNVRRSLVVRRAANLFISPAASFRLSHRKPQKSWPDAMVDRLQVLASLAADREVTARPILLTDQRAVQAAATLLPEGAAYIGFAPGAGGASKRWPLERFIAMAQRQTQQGRTPVFFIGPQELEMTAPIRDAVPKALLPECDRCDGFLDVKGPLLTVALAGRLTAAVANDAGPGHMLAAGGAPLLSLQGARRKAVKFHPAAARLSLLVAEDFGASMDMAAISLSEADRALDALIARAAS